MTDTATDERPWLSLTEAAELTGLDREALRSRARRGLVPNRKGNRGQLLVQVPADLANGHDRDDDHDLTGLRAAMTDLVAEVGELRVALARAEADRDAAKAIATAELAAKDTLVALKQRLPQAKVKLVDREATLFGRDADGR